MSKIDLGSVSAFDIAVKNGYAGTEADWVNDIANASEYSSSANESAQAAEASAGQAAESAEEARIRYGSPLVATTVSAMTDTNRVYVYTGNAAGYTTGNWYYHNGTAWVSGGAYNGGGVNTDDTLSVEGMPADAKAVGALIGDIDDLETIDKTDLVSAINEASKSGGGGITETQKELIVTILRNALYSSDQSENIDALEEAFANPVSYITASIYLHGNTIYTDDTLDTLRQYLTVIAYFEDGTNQAVTGYTLSGTLTAGTSVITITYKDATTTVNVPVSQAVVRYTITNNLTGVTNSNTDSTIADGNTYIGTLSANTSGYKPSNVSVTVGGTNVTSTVYDGSTYTITIPNVSGNVVITAEETENPLLPVYTLASPMTENGTVDCVLFDQVRDWTIELTVDTPANSGNVTVSNKSADVAYYPFRIGVHYVSGIDVLKVWNSGDALNKSWLDGTIAGTQKVVITYDADGDSIGYWKQTNMKSGRESYGQGSQTIAAGTTITPNEEPFTVTMTGGATLSDLKVYKRVLTKEEISEYVGWTVE